MMKCSYVTTSVFFNHWTAGVTTAYGGPEGHIMRR